MYSEKVLRISFVVVSLLFLWSYLRMNAFKQKYDSLTKKLESTNTYKLDSLQNIVDSLYMENYPCQIELNRFQVAYEIFSRKNPKAASQYGDIISQETE